jgi:NADPH:quinone reductase-like Zn-dependent oxidoreductase
VTGFEAGDAACGIGDASFAVHTRARPDKLAPKPPNLSFEHATAVPISGLAALQGVRDHGAVQAGQKVLIVGASGGVGTFAVQIARGSEPRSPVCAASRREMRSAPSAPITSSTTRATTSVTASTATT